MNIFEVAAATCRPEPIATGFLTELAREEPDFFAALWTLLVNADPGWPAPAPDAAKIDDEVVLFNADDVGVFSGERIDIVASDDSRPTHSVSAELKLFESSVRVGQLDTYARSPLAGSRMVFITPFNRARFPEVADTSLAVREFEAFAARHPERMPLHLSLLDVVELDVAVRDPHWPEFQRFVRRLCVPRVFGGMARSPLLDFFDEASVTASRESLLRSAAVSTDGRIDVDGIQNPRAFADALAILVRSDAVSHGVNRPNDLTPRVAAALAAAADTDVHDAIFALTAQHRGAWVAGRYDYGLRVALSKRASSNVSILQTNFRRNCIVLNHWPWLPVPA
jgi:hypothetical protein